MHGTDNLTRTTKRQNTQITQNNNAKGGLVNSTTDTLKKNLERERRQTEPGLVALFNIQPGNGAGLFFLPRSPHRAAGLMMTMDESLTFVDDFLPQSFDKSRVVMVGTVDDGQFALGQIKHVRKLTVQLQHSLQHSVC